MSKEFVAVQRSQTSRNIEKSKPTGIAAKVKIGAVEVIVYHGMESYLIRTILKELQSNAD